LKNISITKYLILDSKDSILLAMKKLNEGEFRFQLVVSDDKKLLGTISDGDIRRAILEGINLEESVLKCMNDKPKVSYQNKKFEHKLVLGSIPSIVKFLPILDENKYLKYVLIDEEKIINKTALIMAGGYGKRLGDKTKNIPKPLLKIGKKPILEILLNKLEKANYNKIYISTYYLYQQIEKFITNRDSQSNISLLIEDNPMGTAGSINLIPKDEYEMLTVINGDVVSDVDLNAFNSFHIEKKNDITLTVAKYEHQVPFGVVDFNKNNNFNGLDEKPLLIHYVLSGIYCLNKNICNLINKEKVDMTSIISKAKKLDKRIGIFPIYEYWKDVGSPNDFELVNNRENEK